MRVVYKITLSKYAKLQQNFAYLCRKRLTGVPHAPNTLGQI